MPQRPPRQRLSSDAFMHGNKASSVMFVEPKGFSVVG